MIRNMNVAQRGFSTFVRQYGSLRGRVSLITGSSMGIGAATAVELAKHGARIIVTGLPGDDLSATVRDCVSAGAKTEDVLAVSGDLRNDDDIRHIVDKTINEFGRLDVLINNAAFMVLKNLEEISMEEFDDLYRVNYRGQVVITRLSLPHLRKTKGNIINVSTVGATTPVVAAGPYTTFKAALSHFSKVLSVELGREGIRVNCVNPGHIRTNLFDVEGNENQNDFYSKMAQCYPLGHVGEVKDVAKYLTFLASDDAKFVTGASHQIDGGLDSTSALSMLEMK